MPSQSPNHINKKAVSIRYGLNILPKSIINLCFIYLRLLIYAFPGLAQEKVCVLRAGLEIPALFQGMDFSLRTDMLTFSLH